LYNIRIGDAVAIWLRAATAKMLIEKIRLNKDNKVPYKSNKQYSYQSILLDCVQQLADYVIGKTKGIVPPYSNNENPQKRLTGVATKGYANLAR
jgi:hypothetical protein